MFIGVVSCGVAIVGQGLKVLSFLWGYLMGCGLVTMGQGLFCNGLVSWDVCGGYRKSRATIFLNGGTSYGVVVMLL